MELNKLHIHEFSAGFIREGHAVARVFPGIGSDAPGLADAACGDDDALGFENDEAAGFAPIGKSTRHTAAIGENAGDGTLHVDVDALLHATVLKSANHFETRAIAHVTKAFEGVAAKGALQDVAVFGAVKQGAPLFELADAVGSF